MKKLLLSMLIFFALSNLFAQRTNVEVIYGYLYVFPAELGTFDSKPVRVIDQLNSNYQYGYASWRLPSSEELALLRANGYARYDEVYMTSDKSDSRGIVLLVTTKEDVEISNNRQKEQDARMKLQSIKSQTGYIDLGLSSGTKWAAQSKSGYYTYAQARAYTLPSKKQWQELRNECTWTWMSSENGFIIKGKNGNAIFLGGTNGYINGFGEHPANKSNVGVYWSSTWLDERRGRNVYYIFFFENEKIGNDAMPGDYGVERQLEDSNCSIRCVQY